MQGKREECIQASRDILASGFHDPEGLYLVTRELAFVGARQEALEMLERVVTGGFHCPLVLLQDPWLDGLLRGDRASSACSTAPRRKAPPRRRRSGRRGESGC